MQKDTHQHAPVTVIGIQPGLRAVAEIEDPRIADCALASSYQKSPKDPELDGWRLAALSTLLKGMLSYEHYETGTLGLHWARLGTCGGLDVKIRVGIDAIIDAWRSNNNYRPAARQSPLSCEVLHDVGTTTDKDHIRPSQELETAKSSSRMRLRYLLVGPLAKKLSQDQLGTEHAGQAWVTATPVEYRSRGDLKWGEGRSSLHTGSVAIDEPAIDLKRYT
ncbi:hypothetical protein C8R43DRAFT_1145581 [Mycena crocata]|nr:hypothetical protein C8R43DRAFT_1145581 [Mycena crocata]